jgi:hypothetical protein
MNIQRYDPVEYGYTGTAMTGQTEKDPDGDYVLYSDHIDAMDRYKEGLLEWLEAKVHECDELGNMADTTAMASNHDWKHEAYRAVIAHIKEQQ